MEGKCADYYAEFMQYLDENNEVLGTVWPGKSDLYHAVQATLIPYYATDLSIAVAVKGNKLV